MFKTLNCLGLVSLPIGNSQDSLLNKASLKFDLQLYWLQALYTNDANQNQNIRSMKAFLIDYPNNFKNFSEIKTIKKPQ